MHEHRSVVTKFGGFQFQVALAANTIRILKMPTEAVLASNAPYAKLSPAASVGKKSRGERCYKIAALSTSNYNFLILVGNSRRAEYPLSMAYLLTMISVKLIKLNTFPLAALACTDYKVQDRTQKAYVLTERLPTYKLIRE
jgi:hypothetical protein